MEGHPGSFQARHGPQLCQLGACQAFIKHTSGLQRHVQPPCFPPSFSTPSVDPKQRSIVGLVDDNPVTSSLFYVCTTNKKQNLSLVPGSFPLCV